MIMASEKGPWWWPSGTSAPPLKVYYQMKGWAQQTSFSPWAPISPMTISTGYKFRTSGNRRPPTTFQWIIMHDPDYVRWVLGRGPSLSDPNKLLLNKYCREHYEPASLRRTRARVNMEDTLEELLTQLDAAGPPAVTMMKMPLQMMTALPAAPPQGCAAKSQPNPKRARKVAV